jgi:hypothetical protein
MTLYELETFRSWFLVWMRLDDGLWVGAPDGDADIASVEVELTRNGEFEIRGGEVVVHRGVLWEAVAYAEERFLCELLRCLPTSPTAARLIQGRT